MRITRGPVLRLSSVVMAFGFCAMILLQAQAVRGQSDMAKWMPRLGDVFIYQLSVYRSYDQRFPTDDTLIDTCKIVGVDVYIDSLHPHTVVTQSSYSKDTYVSLSREPKRYYFSSSSILGSFPFTITSHQDVYPVSRDFTLDFSQAHVDTTILNADTLETISTVAGEGSPEGSYSADYSPSLRGFVFDYFSWWDLHGNWGVRQSRKLIQAVRSTSGVKTGNPSSSGYFVAAGEKYLHVRNINTIGGLSLDLIDPLGRRVRNWSLSASPGTQDITLSLEGVSDGIYFLRVGDEIKELRVAH